MVSATYLLSNWGLDGRAPEVPGFRKPIPPRRRWKRLCGLRAVHRQRHFAHGTGAGRRKLVEVKEFFRICWDIFILSGNMLDVFAWNTWLMFNVIPVGTCKSLLFFFKHNILLRYYRACGPHGSYLHLGYL